MRSERNLTLVYELLHCVAWMLLQSQHPHRLSWSGENSVEFDPDVRDTELLTKWRTHGDDDDVFDILERLNLVRPVPEKDSHDSDCWQFDFGRRVLRWHLEEMPAPRPEMLDELLPIFLHRARWFERTLGLPNNSSSTTQLALLLSNKPFEAPRHFLRAMNSLAKDGYVSSTNTSYELSPKIRPYIEIAKLGADGVLYDDDWIAAQFLKVWDTMPKSLRTTALNPTPDSKVLCELLERHWDGKRWNELPSSTRHFAHKIEWPLNLSNLMISIKIIEALRERRGYR